MTNEDMIKWEEKVNNFPGCDEKELTVHLGGAYKIRVALFRLMDELRKAREEACSHREQLSRIYNYIPLSDMEGWHRSRDLAETQLKIRF